MLGLVVLINAIVYFRVSRFYVKNDRLPSFEEAFPWLGEKLKTLKYAFQVLYYKPEPDLKEIEDEVDYIHDIFFTISSKDPGKKMEMLTDLSNELWRYLLWLRDTKLPWVQVTKLPYETKIAIYKLRMEQRSLLCELQKTRNYYTEELSEKEHLRLLTQIEEYVEKLSEIMDNPNIYRNRRRKSEGWRDNWIKSSFHDTYIKYVIDKSL